MMIYFMGTGSEQRSALVAKAKTLVSLAQQRRLPLHDHAAIQAKRPKSDLNFPDMIHVKKEISKIKKKKTCDVLQHDRFQWSVQE